MELPGASYENLERKTGSERRWQGYLGLPSPQHPQENRHWSGTGLR